MKLIKNPGAAIILAGTLSGCLIGPDSKGSVDGNATLSSLTVSAAALKPNFDPEDTVYELEVGYSITSVSVMPVAAGKGASIQVNGIPVVSGKSSFPIPLGLGENIVGIVVLSGDGENRKNYGLKVVRKPPDFSGTWIGEVYANRGIADYDSIKTTLVISDNAIVSFRVDYAQSGRCGKSSGYFSSIYLSPKPISDTILSVQYTSPEVMARFQGSLTSEGNLQGMLTFSAGCEISYRPWTMRKNLE